MLRTVQVFGNPLVAGALASAIVLGVVAVTASRMSPSAYDTPLGNTVEQVAVVKRAAVAPAPNLKLNVPHNESQAQAASASTSATARALSQPQIARTAKISLYVANVERAAAAVGRVAKQNAGDVFSSDISNGDATTSEPSGSMEIRVPADRFDASLNALAQTGTVRERSTGAEDLTGDITDSGAKLRNLRRTESDIRAIMDRSGSVAQIMDAENQLSSVREQIETLESELKDMRGRVSYATIDIDMQEEAKSTPVTPTASSQLVSAWHDAVASLGAVTISLIASLLWLVVFVPYFAAIALAGWLVYVQVRRTRART